MSGRENEVVAQVDAPKRDIGQAVTLGKQNKQIAVFLEWDLAVSAVVDGARRGQRNEARIKIMSVGRQRGGSAHKGSSESRSQEGGREKGTTVGHRPRKYGRSIDCKT